MIVDFLSDVKCILKEYVHETEVAIKKRIQKIVVAAIIAVVLLALVVAFFGVAVLFILVGLLKYLSTFMPAWEAWFVIGVTSAVIGAVVLVGLFLILRKQLGPSATKQGSVAQA